MVNRRMGTANGGKGKEVVGVLFEQSVISVRVFGCNGNGGWRDQGPGTRDQGPGCRLQRRRGGWRRKTEEGIR
ncbi:hypothetical protein VNO78_26755 [Psophocarpus tetragonolobus]|uniref:Uncharacterized protein n=1 Tax=Psophocarpus tetragonolobus TaxID=3891 RepID=A0AAN9X9E2_PSOTE